MKYSSLLLLICISLVSSGCAIQHLAPEDAKGIPESRMLQGDLLKQRDDRVEIRFIREDAVLSGVASSANLTIDKEPLARLWAGEKFSIWVEPRLYVLGLRGSERWVNTSAAFYGREVPLWKVEVDARIGRRYDVRVDFTNWTGVRFQASSTALVQ